MTKEQEILELLEFIPAIPDGYEHGQPYAYFHGYMDGVEYQKEKDRTLIRNRTNMQIQIIFSFLDGCDQLCGNFPITEKDISDKESLIEFAHRQLTAYFGFLPKDWKTKLVRSGNAVSIPDNLPTIPKLVKLSCMVSADTPMPDWYRDAEGKIYWEDLNPGEPRPF